MTFKGILTVKDVAQASGRKEVSVRRAIYARTLPAEKKGTGWLIDEKDALPWIEKTKQETRGRKPNEALAII